MEPVETAEVAVPPPSIADGVERRLDPAMIQVDRVGGLVTTVLLGGGTLFSVIVEGIAGVRGLLLLVHFAAAVAVFAALAAWAWIWPPLRWKHASYRVDERGIRLREGVWWRSETDVPRSRIQHTDVSQGPLERAFEIATLVIHTAGTEHSQVVVQGLSKDAAFRIRDNLLHVGAGDAV